MPWAMAQTERIGGRASRALLIALRSIGERWSGFALAMFVFSSTTDRRLPRDVCDATLAPTTTRVRTLPPVAIKDVVIEIVNNNRECAANVYSFRSAE